MSHSADGRIDQTSASVAFQVELAKTQAEPTDIIKVNVVSTEVTPSTVTVDDCLDLANEALENIDLGADLMVTEESVGNDNLIDTTEKEGEEFQELTDEDQEKVKLTEEGGKAIMEKDITGDAGKGKEQAAEGVAKKQDVRRKLLKPMTLAGGSTKMRMVQAMLSPRKATAPKATTAPKAANRPKEESKKTEEKGFTNSKLVPPKN